MKEEANIAGVPPRAASSSPSHGESRGRWSRPSATGPPPTVLGHAAAEHLPATASVLRTPVPCPRGYRLLPPGPGLAQSRSLPVESPPPLPQEQEDRQHHSRPVQSFGQNRGQLPRLRARCHLPKPVCALRSGHGHADPKACTATGLGSSCCPWSRGARLDRGRRKATCTGSRACWGRTCLSDTASSLGCQLP
eukprot:554835-Rhodomonas_salina.1